MKNANTIPGAGASCSPRRLTAGARLAGLLFTAWLVAPAVQADDALSDRVLERLEALERQQAALRTELAERDRRINELEAEVEALTGDGEIEEVEQLAGAREVPVVEPQDDDAGFGVFQPGGAGFKLADTEYGDVNFSAWTYARYLNQQGLDDTYTDAFGRTREIDKRNDFQLNKISMYFKGWIYDPRLRYNLFTWTANTAQGEPAQVVVAGSLSYRFSEALDTGVGVAGLPGTRTLRGTFPYWNKVDHRTVADEFFRPGYTTGIWATGRLRDQLHYKVMLGNNLSQLGVNAAQLDDDLNTVSGSLWWTPQGYYGPAGGYGDFEYHEELATTFGIQATRSEEDRQNQPGTEDIENSQIRLSDGTIIFQPDAFGTDGRIDEVTYTMASLDAGVKYRGWSLEGEYYWRWVDDFKVRGTVPVDDLFDHGFQLQASAMLSPKRLQAYVAGSKVFGEYGDPWDLSIGANWFPFGERLLRLNTELLYLDDSPVGNSSLPYSVGGNGLVFHTNLELMF